MKKIKSKNLQKNKNKTTKNEIFVVFFNKLESFNS